MIFDSILRALADPTRLRILRLLHHMDLAVGELAQVLGQDQPRVSRHVGILCDAGLAERHREGRWTFLRQSMSENSPDPFDAALARMLSAAEAKDKTFAARCAEDRRHLAAIRKSRERAAAEYFELHAEDWDRIRAMISPAKLVEGALLEQLDGIELGDLLDIGTGTGRIAELLAPRARKVVAFDKSPEMLRLARARLQNLPSEKIEIVQGDFVAMPFEQGSFDTVVLHQVLHYAQEPALALQEAARVCRPDGVLAIVDLAAHEHEELRERHSHARLGFSDEQMLELLSETEFSASPPLALPGKDLTIKIWIARRQSPKSRGHRTAERDAAQPTNS